MNFYSEKINNSKILKKLNIESNNFILCTLHREENVENIKKIKGYLLFMKKLTKTFNTKIVFPVHPRTKNKLKNLKLKLSNKIYLTKPWFC